MKPKKISKNVDPTEGKETSQQKFVRLATLRTNNALISLQRLVPLGGYEHTDDQAKKIIDALKNKLRIVENALSKSEDKPKKAEFAL